MARLAGQQVAIELPQLRIRAVGRQQGHAFVAAGLDQARHQEAVEHAVGLRSPHQGGEGRAIGGSGQGPQGNAAPGQQGLNPLEVLQLLPGQRAEHRRQLPITGVAEHQLQGHAGGLPLAMGMIQQHQIGMGESLRQPGGVAGTGQPAHPGGHATDEGLSAAAGFRLCRIAPAIRLDERWRNGGDEGLEAISCRTGSRGVQRARFSRNRACPRGADGHHQPTPPRACRWPTRPSRARR